MANVLDPYDGGSSTSRVEVHVDPSVAAGEVRIRPRLLLRRHAGEQRQRAWPTRARKRVEKSLGDGDRGVDLVRAPDGRISVDDADVVRSRWWRWKDKGPGRDWVHLRVQLIAGRR